MLNPTKAHPTSFPPTSAVELVLYSPNCALKNLKVEGEYNLNFVLNNVMLQMFNCPSFENLLLLWKLMNAFQWLLCSEGTIEESGTYWIGAHAPDAMLSLN